MTCCVLSIRPMRHLHVTKRVTAAVDYDIWKILLAHMDGLLESSLRNTGQEVHTATRSAPICLNNAGGL